MNEYPIKFVHKKCTGVAFFGKKRMERGETLKAEDFIFPEGTHPEPHTPIVCASCGERITPDELSGVGFDQF